MELGKCLAEIRKENGLTQEELAERYSVTRQTISNWENSKSYPDLETLVMISDDFNVSLDAMLKGDREMVSEMTREQKHGKNFKRKIVILVLIGMLIAAGALVFLSKLETTMSPGDYQVDVKMITLDNVKVDETNKVAVYTDVEGGEYTMEEDTEEGGNYEGPEPGVFVFEGEKYASLMTKGYAYELVVTSGKSFDFIYERANEDGDEELTVYRKALNLLSGNKRKRAMTIILSDFGKVYDSKTLKAKGPEAALVWEEGLDD